MMGQCGGVGTRAGGGGIHRESTGLGVAVTVVEWEATKADGDLRAVAEEEELDAAGGERGGGGDGKSRQTVRRVGKEVGRTIEDAMGRYSVRFPSRVDGGGYARYRKGRPDPNPAIAGETEVAAEAREVAVARGGGGS